MSNIHGLNTDDEKPPRSGDGDSSGNESDDEGRQGFFVGGSERSGQQVLGPNQNDRQNRIFNAIRRAGAEQMTPAQMDEMERQKQQQRGGTSAWGGGGFRLGGHGIASEQIGGGGGGPLAATNATTFGSAQRPQQMVRMFMWQNGFSIDDGPLRQFEDNREFMAALMNKRIPPELNLLYPGKEIDLRIERKAEEYVPPKAKPFSGQGHRLGSHLPNVAGAGTSSTARIDIVDLEPVSPLKPPSESLVEKAQKDVQLNEQQPITRIQIRFPDLPQPVVARFNHTASVDQIRSFIVSVQPTLVYRPFHLQTIYPRKLIEDEAQSLEEAKLLNAAIMLKFED